MAEYDGLPLNTPTVIVDNATEQIIATRTRNGGTVEFRPKAGSPADLATKAQDQLVAAVSGLRAYRDAASPSAAQTTATVKLLCRVVLNLLRREFDPGGPVE